MEKSIYTQEYSLFLEQLRKARDAKSLTQAQVAERLQQTQSFISKIERGERRLDVVELRAYCSAIGISFMTFVSTLNTKFHDSPGKMDKENSFRYSHNQLLAAKTAQRSLFSFIELIARIGAIKVN